MGCFLGCFGGAKNSKRRKQRINRGSPRNQRDGVRNVQQQQGVIYAEQSITEIPCKEIPTTNSVSELRDKPEGEEQLIPSPRKRVTFDTNVTTYTHVSIYESTDSLPEKNRSIEKEEEDLERSRPPQSHSLSENDSSVASSVGLYPQNHRYHNVMEGNNETEEYGDSDLDNIEEMDDEGDSDYYNEDDGIVCQEVWSESVLTASMESRTEDLSALVINEEVASPLIRIGQPEREMEESGPKTISRDRSDYVDSVLNPVENTTQWKAVKSKGMQPLKPQKENLVADLDAPHISFSSFEPTFKQSSHSLKPKLGQLKNANNEIAVDSSLSSWLVSPDITPAKKNSYSDLETTTPEKNIPVGSTSPRSYDDRPILGALTVEELKQMSASSSPRKSPRRNPDEMPIIGTVGTYWNNSGSAKHSDSVSSYKGIPNTTSKYREDKRVNWHSTPFEARLERALNQGAAEA
ncbi:Hypothetical predicted protein [Olea europaea subsp. europaea]|uniref:Uncharacterized protein n=3 Tax=Olea europaea subsp. europaea TaxID=158383 RepID=A0A8S0P7B1_OLEEU|nr:Hypothetical predicted protein [Olea europaea subsp. europaea]